MDTLFPSTVMVVINGFMPLFSARVGVYFKGFMVAAMLLGQSRKCVTNIAQVCFFIDRHISSWERFLSHYPWTLSVLHTQVVARIRDQMGKQLCVHGAVLGWVDTTLVAKVRGKMPGVQKWHDHSGNPDRGGSLIGHHWALAGIVCTAVVAGGLVPVCWPLLARLISGHGNRLGFVVNAQGVAQAMTFWDAVCPALVELQTLFSGMPFRVVADAYFAKATFVNRMRDRGIHVITRMRHDAVGWDDPTPDAVEKKRPGPKRKHPKRGTKWTLAHFLESLPHQRVSVWLYGKRQTLTMVTRDMWIRGVTCQKVRVVVVKTTGRAVILLCTDLTLSPRVIVESYGLRFPAELGIRNLKQFFGLGDYQCTGLLSITRFVGLSLISYCVWQLVQLHDEEAEWLATQDSGRAPLSMARLSRAVRRYTVGKLFAKSACSGEFQDVTAMSEQVNRLFV